MRQVFSAVLCAIHQGRRSAVLGSCCACQRARALAENIDLASSPTSPAGQLHPKPTELVDNGLSETARWATALVTAD